MQLDHNVKLNPALLSLTPHVNTTGKVKLDMDKIDATAKDFEAMFMSEMLKPMFEGIQPDENFGGGKGEQVFQSLMLDEYGKNLAATGSLGIADMVKKELIEMQSKANHEDVAQNMHSSSEGRNTTGVIGDV